jgi:hypothetical protein
MKKGLKILLEQRPDPIEAPSVITPSDNSQGDKSKDTDNSKGDKSKDTDNSKGDKSKDTDNSKGDKSKDTDNDKGSQKTPEEVLKGDMTAMFPVFSFYALKNGKSIRFDVKDVDKDAVLQYIMSNTPNDEEIDDRFVHGMISYIISKGGQPFYFTYSRGSGVNGIKDVKDVSSLVESKIGLKSILLKERYVTEQMAGTETVYIFAPEGEPGQISYQLYKGPYAKNKVSDLYSKSAASKSQEVPNEKVGTPLTPEQPNSQEQTSQEQSSTNNDKRPEEEMKVNPKADMVQKKAEKEGVESIINNLNDYQQRVLKNYTNQDWTTEKPVNEDMSVFDVIDLVKQEEAFKVFKTFPLYRPKRMTEQNLTSYAELLDAQNVDRGMCKTTVKMYYDAAKQKKRLSDNAKKQFADYITACDLQIKNFMDLGVTKKKIAAIENDIDESPSYIINYSARTVGGNKF